MTEADRAWNKLAEIKDSKKWEEKTFSKHYCGDFKSRSRMNADEFKNRKSAGRYSYK